MGHFIPEHLTLVLIRKQMREERKGETGNTQLVNLEEEREGGTNVERDETMK